MRTRAAQRAPHFTSFAPLVEPHRRLAAGIHLLTLIFVHIKNDIPTPTLDQPSHINRR